MKNNSKSKKHFFSAADRCSGQILYKHAKRMCLHKEIPTTFARLNLDMGYVTLTNTRWLLKLPPPVGLHL